MSCQSVFTNISNVVPMSHQGLLYRVWWVIWIYSCKKQQPNRDNWCEYCWVTQNTYPVCPVRRLHGDPLSWEASFSNPFSFSSSGTQHVCSVSRCLKNLACNSWGQRNWTHLKQKSRNWKAPLPFLLMACYSDLPNVKLDTILNEFFL